MMKFAASVSLAALALAGCASTAAAPMPPMRRPTARRAAPAAADLSDDSRRRPGVCRRGREGSCRPQRHFAAAPPGSTPPTSPTIPTRWPPISARSAPKRASNMPARRPDMPPFPASISTPRASSTSCAARWCLPAPSDAGRRGRAQRDRDQAPVDLWQGPRPPQWQGDHRRRCRSADGHASQSGRAGRDLAELARECRPADAGRLRPHGRDRQRRRQGARLCRHRRDVAVAV